MAVVQPTHPNAFRVEAADKRAVAARLVAEAELLEARAEELDPAPKPRRAPVKRVRKAKPAKKASK